MKKICVNSNCIGCGMCASIDPEHFEMDGTSQVISNDNIESESLKDAIESCPVAAITIEEE